MRALEEEAEQHRQFVECGYECQIRMLRTRLGDVQQDLAMARVAIHEYEMLKREAGVPPLAMYSKTSTPTTTPTTSTEVSPWNTPKHLYVMVIPPPPSCMGSPKRSYEAGDKLLLSTPRIGKPESAYVAPQEAQLKSVNPSKK